MTAPIIATYTDVEVCASTSIAKVTDPSRSSAEREVFIAAGHAQEAQERALGNAYGKGMVCDSVSRNQAAASGSGSSS